MVGEAATPIVCASLPSSAHRTFTSSTGVQPDGLRLHERRARPMTELHDNGPVVPVGNHRQDVPSVRFGGHNDAHLQGVDLRPEKECPPTPCLA